MEFNQPGVLGQDQDRLERLGLAIGQDSFQANRRGGGVDGHAQRIDDGQPPAGGDPDPAVTGAAPGVLAAAQAFGGDQAVGVVEPPLFDGPVGVLPPSQEIAYGDPKEGPGRGVPQMPRPVVGQPEDMISAQNHPRRPGVPAVGQAAGQAFVRAGPEPALVVLGQAVDQRAGQARFEPEPVGACGAQGVEPVVAGHPEEAVVGLQDEPDALVGGKGRQRDGDNAPLLPEAQALGRAGPDAARGVLAQGREVVGQAGSRRDLAPAVGVAAVETVAAGAGPDPPGPVAQDGRDVHGPGDLLDLAGPAFFEGVEPAVEGAQPERAGGILGQAVDHLVHEAFADGIGGKLGVLEDVKAVVAGDPEVVLAVAQESLNGRVAQGGGGLLVDPARFAPAAHPPGSGHPENLLAVPVKGRDRVALGAGGQFHIPKGPAEKALQPFIGSQPHAAPAVRTERAHGLARGAGGFLDDGKSRGKGSPKPLDGAEPEAALVVFADREH